MSLLLGSLSCSTPCTGLDALLCASRTLCCLIRALIKQGNCWFVPFSLDQQFSTGNDTTCSLPPEGTDVGRHFWLSRLEGFYWHLGAEARDAVRHPAMLRTAPTINNYQPKISIVPRKRNPTSGCKFWGILTAQHNA